MLMTAIVKKNPAPGMEISQVPIPIPSDDEALVEILCTSLCGTDVGIYDWIPWAQYHVKPPIILGHEIVGRVVSVNSSQSSIKKGDIISSETHIYCNECKRCLEGNKHICENLQLFGISRNGGFAQFATIPLRTAWKNDPSLPIEIMSIQEPLGNAVHLLSKSNVNKKNILILGLGPVGLCLAAASKAYGVENIVGVEKSEFRRNLGHQIGIDDTYPEISDSHFNSYDIVYDMSGDHQIIENGLKCVVPGGTFIAFGIPKRNVSLNWGELIINKEVTIKSVFGRKIWQTWQEVSQIIHHPLVNLQPIITHRFSIFEFEDAISCMKSTNCGKIIIYPKEVK